MVILCLRVGTRVSGDGDHPSGTFLMEIPGSWSSQFMSGWHIRKEVSVRKEAFFQSGQIVQVGRAGGMGQLRGNEASWAPRRGSGYLGLVWSEGS